MKKCICVVVSIFILVLLTSCSIVPSVTQNTQTKNGEMKVVVFSYYKYSELETNVNAWLSDHPETEIIDIQYSTNYTGSSFSTMYSCMIWYYGVEQDTETTYNSGGNAVHD